MLVFNVSIDYFLSSRVLTTYRNFVGFLTDDFFLALHHNSPLPSSSFFVNLVKEVRRTNTISIFQEEGRLPLLRMGKVERFGSPYSIASQLVSERIDGCIPIWRDVLRLFPKTNIVLTRDGIISYKGLYFSIVQGDQGETFSVEGISPLSYSGFDESHRLATRLGTDVCIHFDKGIHVSGIRDGDLLFQVTIPYFRRELKNMEVKTILTNYNPLVARGLPLTGEVIVSGGMITFISKRGTIIRTPIDYYGLNLVGNVPRFPTVISNIIVINRKFDLVSIDGKLYLNGISVTEDEDKTVETTSRIESLYDNLEEKRIHERIIKQIGEKWNISETDISFTGTTDNYLYIYTRTGDELFIPIKRKD